MKIIIYSESESLLLVLTMYMWNEEGSELDSDVNGSRNSKLRAESAFGNATENVKLLPWGVMHQSGVLPFGSSHSLPKQGDFAATPDGEYKK